MRITLDLQIIALLESQCILAEIRILRLFGYIEDRERDRCQKIDSAINIESIFYV